MNFKFFDDFFKNSSNEFPVNIYELDNKYLINCYIPGYNKDNISIHYDRNTIRITTADLEANGNIIYEEYYRYKKERTIEFNQGDFTQAKVSYINGILAISIPKSNNSITDYNQISIE